MGLRQRLQLVLAAVVLSLLVITGIVGWQVSSVTQAGRTLTQSVQPSVSLTNAITRGLLDIEVTAARLGLSGSAQDRDDVDATNIEVRKDLDRLVTTTSSDDASHTAALALQKSYIAWFDSTIAPVVAAETLTARRDARQLQTSPAGIASAQAVRDDLNTETASVLQWRSDITDTTTQAFDVLTVVLAFALVVLLAVVLLVRSGLRRWVTTPLLALAEDLRTVTDDDLNHRVAERGPAEIAQTAHDAESMRRSLVHQIDEAVAAREALEQRGPVVAALRRELQGPVDQPTHSIPGIQTAGLLLPAEGVLAGDWFSTLVLADGRLAAVMVDVSGHGPAAGLTALKLKYAMTTVLSTGAGPRAAVEAAAAVMIDEQERFATAIAVTVSGAGDLVWCNAGHPEGWIVGGGDGQRVSVTGPLISALGGTWSQERTSLAVGATVILCSDGLTESRDTHGVMLGDAWSDQNIADLNRGTDSARSALESIAAAARERAATWRVDDLALLALRRTG